MANNNVLPDLSLYHPVPEGVLTLPKGVKVWAISRGSESPFYLTDGTGETRVTSYDHRSYLYFSEKSLSASPANIGDLIHAVTAKRVEGVFSKGMKVDKARWVLCANEFNPFGCIVNDEDLLSFTPVYARVDPHDESDKSHRRDCDGDLWVWHPDTSTWDCDEHLLSEPSLDCGEANKCRPFSFA